MSHLAIPTFESFVINECQDCGKKMDGYEPAMSEEAKRAVRYVRASSVCELAQRDYLLGKTSFAVPVYLRKSQAEIQFEERMSKEVNNG